MIIRKKPLNKMVQTNDHDTVDDNSDAVSMPKSSNTSTLFTPRSVYSHATIPNVTADSKNLESVSRKSNSPLSPPHMVKNLNFFIPTSSRDASVQVGDPPVLSEKRQIAKVMPFPVSPPTTKPVARVSPQPQNISPPVPAVNLVEEKAKNKDKIEAKSPEAERQTPLKSPPPISSVITPTTTVTSSSNNITTKVTPARAAAATMSTTPIKTSPTTKSFPSKSCSPQLPTSSDVPLASEQANTNSTVPASDTAATTTDAETMRIKKKKKKKHHSTVEHSGQEDGVGVEHKKKKKKKQKKEHKEHDASDEPKKKKKKKKVKLADKEGVWVEKQTTPVVASAKRSPLKSPPPPSPTVFTPISHDPKGKADEQVAKESIKQEPVIDTPLSSKRRPSLPRDSPTPSQNNEEPEVEIENKLRPFLLSYYSSSGSDCNSPTVEERELDDLHKTITTPTAATTDDVFTKEQSTKGMIFNVVYLLLIFYCLHVFVC